MTQFFIDNILLFSIVVIAAAALIWPTVMARRYGPEVNTQQATELINRQSAQIVDVRKNQEFQRGHIARSINLPADQIQNQLKQLDKQKPVLLVDETGEKSRMVARLLRGVNFSDIYVLEKGLLNWKKEKLPLEK